MDDKKAKQLIQKWSERDGEHHVKAALIMRRLSSSLVEKLVAGRYTGTIRGATLTIIEDELERVGMIEVRAS